MNSRESRERRKAFPSCGTGLPAPKRIRNRPIVSLTNHAAEEVNIMVRCNRRRIHAWFRKSSLRQNLPLGVLENQSIRLRSIPGNPAKDIHTVPQSNRCRIASRLWQRISVSPGICVKVKALNQFRPVLCAVLPITPPNNHQVAVNHAGHISRNRKWQGCGFFPDQFLSVGIVINRCCYECDESQRKHMCPSR